ncbi:hypothetical protein L7F22_057749 [Adiantum nelumboides]|nr:hypothetical protein [Adiantum nelumboides]
MNEEDDMDTFLAGVNDINEQLISADQPITDVDVHDVLDEERAENEQARAQRTPINGSSGVYDGPAIVKEIELAEPGEESKLVFIAQDLTEVEEAVLKELLKKFKDIFTWTYHDMKGVPPSMVQHTIPMISTAKPLQQRPYSMNPKYAKIIQEELEKLIECGFIYPIEHSEWVSPIVIVPKKNGKLRVCVDLKKVNAATRRDHYPLPYSEHVLERVAGKEAYSFLDGYSGYNQITIALEDQAKTTFITEFGVFAFCVMAFDLTNAPATFQRLINTAFKEYLRDFCEAFLDDLCIYSSWEEHLPCLQKVFEKCKLYRISLNRFILLFAEIARPLYKIFIEFKWTEECDQAYEVLKKALASAPNLRAPDWNVIFHVHIDASNFAIGCVLTQSGEHKLDYPISFSSR